MEIDHRRLKEILHIRRIKLCELAKATSGTSPSYLSAVVNGWQRVGPVVAEKLRLALSHLGVSDLDISEIFNSNVAPCEHPEIQSIEVKIAL